MTRILIELLICVAIITLLLTVTFPAIRDGSCNQPVEEKAVISDIIMD